MQHRDKLQDIEVQIMINIDRELQHFNSNDPNSLIRKWFNSKGISKPRISNKVFTGGVIFLSGESKPTYSGWGITVFPKQKTLNNVYIGQYSKGKRDGQGKRLMRTFVYLGEYSMDSKHGQATMINAETGELIFKGTFNMDKMHGKCFWKDPSHEFSGEINNQIYHGPCTIRYPNGDVFKGTMKNGNIEGHGTLEYGNGDKYEGEFKKNIMHGRGMYTWYNGESYDGQFIDGKIRGEGVMRSPIGTTAKGDFSSKRVPFELN